MDEFRPLRAEISSAIGMRIQKLRGPRTQSELARRVGISRAAVSALEAGNHGAAIETLCRFAEALDVEPGQLLPSLDEIRQLLSESGARSPEAIVDEFLGEQNGRDKKGTAGGTKTPGRIRLDEGAS